MRERKFDHYARILQNAFKKYVCQRVFDKQKENAAGNIDTSLTIIRELRAVLNFEDIFTSKDPN